MTGEWLAAQEDERKKRHCEERQQRRLAMTRFVHAESFGCRISQETPSPDCPDISP
jgi:hypothetical protein